MCSISLRGGQEGGEGWRGVKAGGQVGERDRVEDKGMEKVRGSMKEGKNELDAERLEIR